MPPTYAILNWKDGSTEIVSAAELAQDDAATRFGNNVGGKREGDIRITCPGGDHCIHVVRRAGCPYLSHYPDDSSAVGCAYYLPVERDNCGETVTEKATRLGQHHRLHLEAQALLCNLSQELEVHEVCRHRRCPNTVKRHVVHPDSTIRREVKVTVGGTAKFYRVDVAIEDVHGNIIMVIEVLHTHATLGTKRKFLQEHRAPYVELSADEIVSALTSSREPGGPFILHAIDTDDGAPQFCDVCVDRHARCATRIQAAERRRQVVARAHEELARDAAAAAEAAEAAERRAEAEAAERRAEAEAAERRRAAAAREGVDVAALIRKYEALAAVAWTRHRYDAGHGYYRRQVAEAAGRRAEAEAAERRAEAAERRAEAEAAERRAEAEAAERRAEAEAEGERRRAEAEEERRRAAAAREGVDVAAKAEAAERRAEVARGAARYEAAVQLCKAREAALLARLPNEGDPNETWQDMRARLSITSGGKSHMTHPLWGATDGGAAATATTPRVRTDTAAPPEQPDVGEAPPRPPRSPPRWTPLASLHTTGTQLNWNIT
jgi:hypothetical protein